MGASWLTHSWFRTFYVDIEKFYFFQVARARSKIYSNRSLKVAASLERTGVSAERCSQRAMKQIDESVVERAERRMTTDDKGLTAQRLILRFSIHLFLFSNYIVSAARGHKLVPVL